MRAAAAVLLLVVPVAAGAGTVAARVGEAEIPLSAVDARTRGKAEGLLARIEGLVAELIDERIDARLLARAGKGEPPEPVVDEQVETFLREHPEFFDGPRAPGGSARDPAVQRAAVRHYLEREARTSRDTARLERLRARARIERLPPPRTSLTEPLAPDRVVARVDGAPVHAAEIERAGALRLYRARGELYRERERRLAELVDERLLAERARRVGLSADALVEAAAGPPVDEAAVRAYVREEEAAGRTAPHPERARPYLEFRRRERARAKVLEAARRDVPVELLMVAPAPPVLPVNTDGAPTLGGGKGAPRLVVYANYRCAQCRIAHAQIDRLLARESPPQVVLRDFLPTYDPAARAASRWLRCAARQQRHAALRRLLMEGDPPDFAGAWLGGASDREVASRIGAAPEPFLRCVADPEIERAIERDTQQARELGFDAPPGFVAEGRGLSGAQSADTLERALRGG